MTGIVDLNCRMFTTRADYVDFVLTDDICRLAAEDGAAADLRSPGYPATPVLTPPVYYSLANGVADNARINDALLKLARSLGTRAFCVAEPKYGEAARDEIRRVAALGAAGIVWSPRAQGMFGNDLFLAQLCDVVADLGLVSMVHSAPYSINESLVRLWHLAERTRAERIVVLGALASYENIETLRQNGGGPAKLAYDISGMTAPRDLDAVARATGPERLLLGSGGARFLPGVLSVVEGASLDVNARGAILGGNAATLLGIGDAR